MICICVDSITILDRIAFGNILVTHWTGDFGTALLVEGGRGREALPQANIACYLSAAPGKSIWDHDLVYPANGARFGFSIDGPMTVLQIVA